jgi:hypothetical protein
MSKKPVNRIGPINMKPAAKGNAMGENLKAVTALNSARPIKAKMAAYAALAPGIARKVVTPLRRASAMSPGVSLGVWEVGSIMGVCGLSSCFGR